MAVRRLKLFTEGMSNLAQNNSCSRVIFKLAETEERNMTSKSSRLYPLSNHQSELKAELKVD
jgi:hypothetical protein